MKQVMQNMKTGAMRVAEVPVPACRSGGVLVQVRASCISAGTERHIMSFARKSYLEKARARPDLVKQVVEKARKEGLANTYSAVMSRLDVETALGYSCAGVVIEAGGNADGFAVGDRVACAGMGFASHAEYVYVPKHLVAKIPDGVSFEAASYTTVGAIAMQGVRTLEMTLGERVLVIGMGSIGLLAMQMIEASGGTAMGIDLDPGRIEDAKAIGLDKVCLRSDDVEQAVMRWTGGIGADAVLITAGAPTNDPIELGTAVSRKRGRIVVLGNVPLEASHKPFYEKEMSLKMSTSYGPGRYDPVYELDGVDYPLAYVRWTENRNMQAFLELIAANKIAPDPLTSHRFPIDAAGEAYAVIEGKVEGQRSLGVLFTFPENTADVTDKRRVDLRSATELKATEGRVGVGWIGAGPFSRGTLMPAFKAVERADLRAVATASGVSSEGAGRKFGFGYATTDYKRMLQDPAIDLVVVATQHRMHARMVIEALQAGKHVFVEKPLCVDLAELAAVRAAWEGTGLLLHVGHNRRFAPLVDTLKDHFADCAEPLFSIYRVNAGYAPPGSTVHREGGRIIGESCHFLDTLVHVTGSPISDIQIRSLRSDNSALTDEDSVTLLVSHEGGHLSTVHYLARGNGLVHKEHLEVHGGIRSAVLHDYTSVKLFAGTKIKTKRGLTQDKGHREQVRRVIDAIDRGLPAPVPFDVAEHITEWTIRAAETLANPG